MPTLLNEKLFTTAIQSLSNIENDSWQFPLSGSTVHCRPACNLRLSDDPGKKWNIVRMYIFPVFCECSSRNILQLYLVPCNFIPLYSVLSKCPKLFQFLARALKCLLPADLSTPRNLVQRRSLRALYFVCF